MKRKIITATEVNELRRVATESSSLCAESVYFAKLPNECLFNNPNLGVKTVWCGLFFEHPGSTTSTMTYEIVRWDWDRPNADQDHLNVDRYYISVVSGGTAEVMKTPKNQILNHYSLSPPMRYSFCFTSGKQPAF